MAGEGEAMAAAAAAASAASAAPSAAAGAGPGPAWCGEGSAAPAVASRPGAAAAPAGAKGFAYAFVLYGTNCELYFLGATAVAWSLIRHASLHRRVLLHTPDVPRGVLDAATASELFDEVIPTEYVEASEVFFSNPSAHRRFGKIFTKYRVLGLTQYEKVLLLDTDLYVRGNIDGLFALSAPAAMVRGPDKPQEGTRLAPGTPVNAGVMLLQPDPALLEAILEEITGPRPRRLPYFNSPDADYLTEHPSLCGTWSSIPLEYNFQLEFDHLDPGQGTVRFSAAREAHFSEAGASLPWASVKVLHFSGAKPWKHLLEDASTLQRLRVLSPAASGEGVDKQASVQALLGAKLEAGIREYAKEVADFQGLCSQLPFGNGLLWRERPLECVTLPAPPEATRARLHSLLPQGGRWFEGQRDGAVVWVPPGAGLPVADAPAGRVAAVAVYLEIIEAKPPIYVGNAVKATIGGAEHEYTVVGISEAKQMATVKRSLALPEDWQAIEDKSNSQLYYHNMRTGKVQWEFPVLPYQWEADIDQQTTLVYYHNTLTDECLWEPPTEEELEKPLDELKLVPKPSSAGGGDPGQTRRKSDVAIWRRSFTSESDRARFTDIRQALHTAAQALVAGQGNGCQ